VPGSVAFSFVQKGVLLVPGATAGEDRVMEIALEAGADDVAPADDSWQVTCPPAQLAAVRDAFEAQGLPPEESQIMWLPLTTVAVEADDAHKVIRLVEVLEEHDDVQKVYTNADMPE
jgi:transcriptional/translational regulatory protein YebC/TACO1